LQPGNKLCPHSLACIIALSVIKQLTPTTIMQYAYAIFLDIKLSITIGRYCSLPRQHLND